MKTLGMLLVIAGLGLLVDNGHAYNKLIGVSDAEPARASFQRTKHVYLEPLAGVSAAAGGALLMMIGRKPKRA